MSRKNVVGSKTGELAPLTQMEPASVHRQNLSFWNTAGSECLGVTALPRYGAFMTEETLHFLEGPVCRGKVLEIGCGNGRSLAYMGRRGAGELWGLDLSSQQLRRAKELLAAQGMKAQLFCAPMEEECGLPQMYFDLVYSIYGIGWTTDLSGTFRRVASYLKKGGTFLFSWSHPIHKCIAVEKGKLVWQNSYFDQSWYTACLEGEEFVLCNRTLSAYINALASAGFAIEQMAEEPEDGLLQQTGQAEFARKARMLPVTFVIKARKL